MQTNAVQIHRTGGPEVLTYEPIELGPPAATEVQVRHEAIGVNFIDINQRAGVYRVELPAVLGSEGAGVVTEVGADVKDLKVGDRVVYLASALGSYAETRNVPTEEVVALPDGISPVIASAIFLKGLTAEMLLRRVYQVRPQDIIVIHAAAGGVGSLMVPWAKHLGAIVIGVVGTQAKAEVAQGLGCDHVVVSSNENVAARVKEITRGSGARAVYDSVGKDTFDGSLDSLARTGRLILFGQSSGPVPPFDVSRLGAGSYFLTRPRVAHYARPHDRLVAMADELFGLVKSGVLKPAPPRTYPLRAAAEAHAAIQSRQTTGMFVLLP